MARNLQDKPFKHNSVYEYIPAYEPGVGEDQSEDGLHFIHYLSEEE